MPCVHGTCGIINNCVCDIGFTGSDCSFCASGFTNYPNCQGKCFLLSLALHLLFILPKTLLSHYIVCNPILLEYSDTSLRLSWVAVEGYLTYTVEWNDDDSGTYTPGYIIVATPIFPPLILDK